MLWRATSEDHAIFTNDMQALQSEALKKWLTGNITDSPTISLHAAREDYNH